MPNTPQKNNYKPLIFEPRCSICTNQFRNLVDTLAAQAYRPTAIARVLQEHDEDFAKKNQEAVRKAVYRHIKEHLDLDNDALRKLVEEKARAAGIYADERKATLVTRGAILEQVIQKGWKQLIDPDSRVPYEFILKAVEMQESAEKQEAVLMVDQLTRQLQAIIQSIKEIVPEPQWNAVILRARELHDQPLIELNPGGAQQYNVEEDFR